MFSTTSCLVAAFVMAGSIGTAETFDAASIGLGEVKSTVTEIHDGMVMVKAHTEYSGFDSRDPRNPLATVSGPCVGTVLVQAGIPRGSGLCHYTDKSGEDVVISWEARSMSADGRMRGIWRVEGGTGKWVGATGGGGFDSGVDAKGEYTNIVRGALTLP